MDFKTFQRQCKYRLWESFGHYACEKTGKACPRSRSDKCPDYKRIIDNHD